MKRPKAPGEGGRVRDPFLDALGENVKIARIRAKLSPKELAEALGTGQSWVYMVEDGQQNLQLSSLRRLAQVLGTTVRDLIPEEAGPGSGQETAREVHETFERTIVQVSEALRALHKLQALTDRHGTPASSPASTDSSPGQPFSNHR